MTVTLTGIVNAGGKVYLRRTLDDAFLVRRDATLAAGDVLDIGIDADQESTFLSFLVIQARLTSDETEIAEVSYGTSDADAADAAAGTAWNVVGGDMVAFLMIPLSDTNHLYLYNHGDTSVEVTVVAGG